MCLKYGLQHQTFSINLKLEVISPKQVDGGFNILTRRVDIIFRFLAQFINPPTKIVHYRSIGLCRVLAKMFTFEGRRQYVDKMCHSCC